MCFKVNFLIQKKGPYIADAACCADRSLLVNHSNVIQFFQELTFMGMLVCGSANPKLLSMYFVTFEKISMKKCIPVSKY